MATVVNQIASFPGVTVSATYDTVSLRIGSITVVNNSSVPVWGGIYKTTNPKRTFTQTFSPSTSGIYNLPPYFDYSIDPVDNTITMLGLEIYVRYG